MKFCIKDYLNQLLEFSDKIIGINLKFKDETLEENYTQSLKNSEYQKSKILLSILILGYLLTIFLATYKGKFVLIRSSYILIGGLIIEIILAIINNRPYENVKTIMAIKYFRSIIAYLIGIIVLMFPVDSNIPVNDPIYLRFVYITMVKCNDF